MLGIRWESLSHDYKIMKKKIVKYFMKSTTSEFPSVSEPIDIPLLPLLIATNDNSKINY